jgi:hypothetical protein
MFKSGVMLKLVRLARIPRLAKLLDPIKFKRMLMSVDGPNPSIDHIIRRDYNLTMYNIFNLIVMMMFLIYGIGCLFYLMSNQLYGETFVEYYDLV